MRTTPGGYRLLNEGHESPVDCEGSSLQVGDLVVYNLSGGLARGNIASIKRRNDYIAKNNPQSNLQWVITMLNGSVVKNTDGIYRLRDYDRGGPEQQ